MLKASSFPSKAIENASIDSLDLETVPFTLTTSSLSL